MIDIREAKDFFFRAMLQGWITNSAIMLPDPNNPGFKTIIIKEDDLQLVDSYCTIKGSDMSAGSTIIRYRGTPIWVMYYSGYYVKEAIPLVKEALQIAYEDRRFIGGRGISLRKGSPTDRGDAYVNKPEFQMDEFSWFRGHEYVVRPDQQQIGFHQYHGVWLPENVS